MADLENWDAVEASSRNSACIKSGAGPLTPDLIRIILPHVTRSNLTYRFEERGVST
jgi:hypothetical protein